MLRAIKEQLKSLAQDEHKDFHVRLRKTVGKKATAILEERLKKVIVLMPDLVQRIHDYWRMQPEASSTKRLGSHLLSYLYLPKDLISEEDWGLFGYLDDAYMVAAVYERIIEELSSCGFKVLAGDLALHEDIKLYKRSIRIVIPNVCQKIDKIIDDLSKGKNDSYISMAQESA
ncbi:MAG: DUF1232 domain-containing protein [Candidatus Omnitrophica bacterium]|nr:DUF1232 domain-containing protein [Candidatus Omnitrophota bacterium]